MSDLEKLMRLAGLPNAKQLTEADFAESPYDSNTILTMVRDLIAKTVGSAGSAFNNEFAQNMPETQKYLAQALGDISKNLGMYIEKDNANRS